MASEIRVNSLSSRTGLSTVTFTDTGPIFSGITTFQDNSGFNVGTGGSIFSPTSNTVTLGTNSAERLRITSSGVVGINKTSPSSHAQLDVVGSSYWPILVKTTSTAGGGVAIKNKDDVTSLYTGSGGSSWLTGSAITDGLIRTQNTLLIATNGNNERLRITSGGKIGIGITNPEDYDSEADDLVIGSGGADTGITVVCGSGVGSHGSIFFADGTSSSGAKKKGQIRYEQNNEIMSFHTNEQQRLTIDLNGNVTLGYAGNSLYFQNGFNNRASRIQNGGASGSANLKFYTNNAGTEAERLRIDSSGFITQKFTSNNSTTAEGLFINNLNNGTGNNASLILSNDSGERKKAAIALIDTGSYGAGDLVFALDGADSGELHLTNDEKLRIGSGGNLALGGQNTSGYSGHTNFFIGGIANLYAETTAASGGSLSISNNAYINSSGNWVYRVGGKASNSYQYDGGYGFRTAGTGSAGGTISWTERFSITNAGSVTTPNQPGFFARRSIAGDGRAAQAQEWTVTGTGSFNTGSHFNTSNGRFTAPVAGRYIFTAAPGYKQTSYDYNFKFLINGGQQSEPVRIIDGGDDLTSHSGFTGTVIYNLNANDYVQVEVGYIHHVNLTYNFFMGYLLG